MISIISWRVTKLYTHHGRRVVHHLLNGQITFVAYEQFVDVLARIALNLLQPLLDVVEGLLVRAVVDYDDAVCAPVVRRRDRTEALQWKVVMGLELE